MYYITVMQSPRYHQMTLEEFLFKDDIVTPAFVDNTITGTKTYEVSEISDNIKKKFDVTKLILKLCEFNRKTEKLHEVDRHQLYSEFYIPKKSGGLRKIDAPNKELMDALRELKEIFEKDFHALYHTAAFAYIKHRCTIDALKRHTANDSKWYAKYDLHDFFGSTTKEYVMHMFSMIFPFSEVIKIDGGRQEFEQAIDLAFLDGGLPQGTPISPLITNVMMIPVDFKVNKQLRDFEGQKFCYTRYADDFQVSSRYNFNFRDVEKLITDTLAEFGAPFNLNNKKTRYGSNAGRNFNLGLMINANNNITIGYKKKERFKAMLSNYIMDKRNGIEWDKNDIQVMDGYRNYYRMVEGASIDGLVNHIGEKYGVDVVAMIKNDLQS